MKDIFFYVGGSAYAPFKSRLFIFTFFLFFIPVSSFGVYYQSFGENSNDFFSYFTPESIFTFTVPLMATVIMEGVMASIGKLNDLDKESAEYQLFRDSLVLAVIVLLIQSGVIYLSISKNNVLLSVCSVIVLLIFWILICSTKSEFSPSKSWKTIGTADTASSSAISND